MECAPILMQAAALVWHVKKGYCTFLKASKKVDNNLHRLIGEIWFTGWLWEKRNPDEPRKKQNAEKNANEKKGSTFPQPSTLETASSSYKTKHVSISLRAT